MEDDEIISEFLEDGLDDWVSLHNAVWFTTHGNLDEGSKERAIEILGRLYSSGLMVPGRPGDAGFEDWPGTVVDWLIRSRDELDELDWRPMGAGFRLRLTEYGEAMAREAEGH
ncbi:hypothetical protein [Promicromonospora sp. NPDC023987]|uniref:hypothetical protein n=1 Tax=Promicromonospora sp. NPDC023987 TaxID=3155360 RepID=UPI0033C3E73D